MDICPSKDELLALLAGSDEGSPGLRAHVDDCPDCRRSVARLLGALRLGAEYQAFAEPADRGDLLTEVDMSPQAAQRIFEAADEARRQSLSPPARCPSEDQLAKLLAEPEAVSPAVHGHVEQCSACRERVELLRGLLEHAADYDAFLCGGEEAPSDVHDRIFAAVSAKIQPPAPSCPSPICPNPICPTNDELIAVLAGSGQHASHRSHLDDCEVCREKAAKLLGAMRQGADCLAFVTGKIVSAVEPIPAEVTDRIYRSVTERVIGPRCPPWNDLLAVLAGSSDDAALRAHLSQCPNCCETASTLLTTIHCWLEKQAFETGEISSKSEPIPADVAKRIYEHLLERVPPSGCPSWNELLAVLAGSADDAASRTHINQCATCQATAAKLLGAIRLWLEKRAFETGEIRKKAEPIPKEASERVFREVTNECVRVPVYRRAASLVWHQGKNPLLQAIAASLMIAVTGVFLFKNNPGPIEPLPEEPDPSAVVMQMLTAANAAATEFRLDDARGSLADADTEIERLGLSHLRPNAEIVRANIRGAEQDRDKTRDSLALLSSQIGGELQQFGKTVRRGFSRAGDSLAEPLRSAGDSVTKSLSAAKDRFVANVTAKLVANRGLSIARDRAPHDEQSPNMKFRAAVMTRITLHQIDKKRLLPDARREYDQLHSRCQDILNDQYAQFGSRPAMNNPLARLAGKFDTAGRNVKQFRQRLRTNKSIDVVSDAMPPNTRMERKAATDRPIKHRESKPRDIASAGVSPTGEDVRAGG